MNESDLRSSSCRFISVVDSIHRFRRSTRFFIFRPTDFQTTHHQVQIFTEISTSQPILRVREYPFVWLYISPVIFVLGVVGNVFTVLVMRRRRLRRSTTAVYLILLAIADTMALVTRIPAEFFEAAGVGSFKDINRWTCRIEKFSFYTFSDIAIWILVLFTIDRLIAVCLPLYKAKVCLPRRALMACGVISMILVGKNLHVFWSRGEEYDATGNVKVKCGRAAYHFEHYVRPWIAFTTITLMPFLIIVTSNIAIIVHLVRARHKVVFHQAAKSGRSEKSSLYQRSFQNSTLSTGFGSFFQPWVQRLRGPKKVFTQTTLMCLSTSAVFLICVSPSIILTLGRVRWIKNPSSIFPFGVAQALNYQLSCLNHAINFFLYCLSGQRFRQELFDLLKGRPDGRYNSRRPGTEPNKASNSLSESNRQDNLKGSTDMLDAIQETSPKTQPDRMFPDVRVNSSMIHSHTSH